MGVEQGCERSWEGFGGGGGQEVWMRYYAGDAAVGWGLPGRQESGKGIRMPQEGAFLETGRR